MTNKQHRNYVCFFSNGTFKIGVTKDPTTRLAAYVREATRFDRKVTGFWTSPLRDKTRALALETAIKHVYSDCAIPRHRETFDGVKVRGDAIVRAFGMTDVEKFSQDRHQRKFHSLFGRWQASTGTQRAAIVVDVYSRRGVCL